MKKTIITVFLILLLPLLILTGLYFAVPPFQEMVNQLLIYAPFGIGEKIASKPTDEQIEQQVAEVASYLLKLDQERALDKLKVIKTEDKSSYDKVIKAMIRLSPHKTEKLIKAIRAQNQADSTLLNTLKQIDEEKATALKEKADFLMTLDALSASQEIKNILDEEVDAHRTVAAIYENMDNQKILEINKQLFKNDVSQINDFLSPQKKTDLQSLTNAAAIADEELEQLAENFASKRVKELVPLIGDTNTYKLEELAIIYQKLGPKLGGAVLAEVNNPAFTEELNAEISRNLRSRGLKNDFSKDLYKSVNIHRDYADNLSELVRIYQNVDDAKVADTIRRLYWNSDKVETYTLSNGEEISISDSKLALDLLQSFSPEKIASILAKLDNNISTEISTKIVLPNLD